MTQPEDEPTEEASEALNAGAFSTWLDEIAAAIAGTTSSDVPCGTCTGCCTSSQFIHIGPDETDALAHIPAALLFPAPRMPRGHVLMGYDRRGHCPMLVDDACSIYAHRPRTCRTYDCRVFTAAGIAPDDDKPVIAERVAMPADECASDASRGLSAAGVVGVYGPGLAHGGTAVGAGTSFPAALAFRR